VVDSSCFLVSAKASFYPVFGRLRTQIGPKFSQRLRESIGIQITGSQPPISAAVTPDRMTWGQAQLRRPFVSIIVGDSGGPMVLDD
jgi:hypothetical protein